MNQQNPYFHTYQQQMHKVKDFQSKQHLLSMAVNLAHVHNLLGLMISDVIKFMGKVPFDQNNAQNLKGKSPQTQNHQQRGKAQKNELPPKIKLTKPVPAEKYASQKMEIQPFPTQPPNLKEDQYKIKTKDNFPEHLFQTEQKPKMPVSSFTDFFAEMFLNVDQECAEKSNKKDHRKGSNDSTSSKTQTAQIIRSNQDDKKLAAKDSFDELNKYALNADKRNNLNAKNSKELQKKARKQRSPFFDLFDSQTQSFEQPQITPNPICLNNQDVEIDKPYPQTQQVNHDSINMLKKMSGNLYSPQMKKPKDNSKKNGFEKPTNLLDITQWSNTGQNNTFKVQEDIDEIESSEKKPLNQVLEYRTNGSKPEVKPKVRFDDVEYIPRREQKGRKKSDREGLKGSQCPDCKAFYNVMSVDNINFKDMCECSSRHKSSTTYMGKHKVENYSQAFELD